jgi:hypothetical protein
MGTAEHVHFGAIVGDMKPRFVEEHLYQVETEARRVCADVAASVRREIRS